MNNGQLHNLYSSANTRVYYQPKEMVRNYNTHACVINVHKIAFGKPEAKKSVRRPKHALISSVFLKSENDRI
jgi:hypothetical protein